MSLALLLKTIYKRVLGDYDSPEMLKDLHVEHFAENVRRGVEEGLLDERLTKCLTWTVLQSSRSQVS
jgi:ribonucleoside-diphosphate reductase alpha chain